VRLLPRLNGGGLGQLTTVGPRGMARVEPSHWRGGTKSLPGTGARAQVIEAIVVCALSGPAAAHIARKECGGFEGRTQEGA